MSITKLYAVVCIQDVDRFIDVFGVYESLEKATNVCKNMNEYEAVNHAKDYGSIQYYVKQVPREKEPIYTYIPM